jgi:hypothetical protein
MADNIFQRMSKVTQEITAVAKNLSVGNGKNQYKAVGEADILSAVRPAEAKHGVYSYPYSREIVESGTMEKETQYGKSVQMFMRIKVVYRFICIDDPASYIDVESYGDGVDSQDKAPGKAMTYADKYALMKAYKIITGDDPDQYASEPQNKVDTKRTPGRRAKDPSRKEMLDAICKKYNAETIAKILEANGLKSVDDMNDMQVTALYTRATTK